MAARMSDAAVAERDFDESAVDKSDRGLLQREADDCATGRDGDVLASVELVDHW